MQQETPSQAFERAIREINLEGEESQSGVFFGRFPPPSGSIKGGDQTERTESPPILDRLAPATVGIRLPQASLIILRGDFRSLFYPLDLTEMHLKEEPLQGCIFGLHQIEVDSDENPLFEPFLLSTAEDVGAVHAPAGDWKKALENFFGNMEEDLDSDPDLDPDIAEMLDYCPLDFMDDEKDGGIDLYRHFPEEDTCPTKQEQGIMFLPRIYKGNWLVPKIELPSFPQVLEAIDRLNLQDDSQ
ncbi:uncharacterized protein LOC128343386 [Hemicordylus capensis]|uniref:uncharacterized protein LOC128343386 n=1 Tax=Hemicordylus capensis TaxID=884348 RepID=UPI002302E3CC|nr:uncharacterized protein LOC128343386 [Hemicordylus capensis]